METFGSVQSLSRLPGFRGRVEAFSTGVSIWCFEHGVIVRLDCFVYYVTVLYSIHRVVLVIFQEKQTSNRPALPALP